MSGQPSVSVILPTSNRAESLARTLKSLSQVSYPAERMEVVVIDDGSTDNTPGVVEAAGPIFGEGRLRYDRIAKSNICHAKNRGLELARNEMLVFTDDDCTFDPDWLKNLVQPFENAALGAVGGPDRAPPDSAPLAGAVDYAFTGLLGSGGVRRGGTGKRVAQFYPRGCNMAVRRSALDLAGKFDERLYNGEEIDLDYRISEAGFTLAYQPSCPVWHHRRSSFAGLARQVFHRGVTRRMLFLKNPGFFEFGYLAPAGIVLYFVLLTLASTLFALFSGLLVVSALAYAAFAIAGGAHCLATRRRPAEAALVPLVLPLQHFAYGLGLLVARFTSAFRSLKKDLETARRRNFGAPLKVLISNDGYGPNQGDRAILQVMISDLQQAFTGVQIRGFLNSWGPKARDLCRFWDDMKWADIFLLGGGQLLHDQTCLLFLLASLAKIAVARAAGTSVVCYAIGAGPITFRFGRLMTRLALNRTKLIIARDESTRKLLREIGVTTPVEVTACPAFRLPSVSAERSGEILAGAGVSLHKHPLIVICPRRWFQYSPAVLPVKWRLKMGIRIPGAQEFSVLIDRFAGLINRLMDEMNAAVLLLPMKRKAAGTEPGQDDDVVCREIRERTAKPGAVSLLDAEVGPSEIKGVLGRADCVVSMRMHAVIMAASQGVPSVGVILSRKFDDLFDRLNGSEYMMPVEELDVERLYQQVKKAIENRAELRECLLRETAALADISAGSIVLLRKWVDKQRAENAGT